MRYRVEVAVIEPDPVKDPTHVLVAIRNDLQTIQQTALTPFQQQLVDALVKEVVRFDRQIKTARAFGISADTPDQALAEAGEMLRPREESQPIVFPIDSAPLAVIGRHYTMSDRTEVLDRGGHIAARDNSGIVVQDGEGCERLLSRGKAYRDALANAVYEVPIFLGKAKVTITQGDQLGYPWSREIAEMCRVTFSGGQEFERRAYRDESRPVEWLRIRPDGEPVSAREVAALDALVDAEVEDQERWAEADSQMGDPYP